MGRLRVHTLAGRFEEALRSLEPLHPVAQGAATHHTQRLPSCHTSLLYHSGFCYLMLGRYLDAASCLNSLVAYVGRLTASNASQVRETKRRRAARSAGVPLAAGTARAPCSAVRSPRRSPG